MKLENFIYKCYEKYINRKIYVLIFIMRNYSSFIEKITKNSIQKRLTIYEEAYGFDDKSRTGSKNFNNYFGDFIEKMCLLIKDYKKINKTDNRFEGNDGYNNTTYFEIKSRHDTMNQGSSFKIIKPKLKLAIKEKKEFILFIHIDNKNKSKNIPLHLGNGLKKIKDLEGYDSEKHRWISGDEMKKYIYGNLYYKDADNFILQIISAYSPLKKT